MKLRHALAITAAVGGLAAAALAVGLLLPRGSQPRDREAPSLGSLVRIVEARSRRVSSWDRDGGNLDCRKIGPGETAVLANLAGPGVITHLYFTLFYPDPLDFRDAVLRIYWDDNPAPSVEVPFGDFFCVGHGLPRPFESALVSVTFGQGPGDTNCGFNCYFPMPFHRRARIELENQSDRTFGGGLGRVWYHIEWEKHPGALPNDVGRFHARWRRERLTERAEAPRLERGVAAESNRTGADNYVLLEARGRGHVVGQFLQIDNLEGGWYGEGDDMVFIDDDTWPPSIHGTGTEEIFGAGALPDRPFAGLRTGFLLMENRGGGLFNGKNAMYRWYLEDPIRFTRRIRMTIEHGHANQAANDYASVVYWYQERPQEHSPELPPLAERRPRRPESFFRAQQLGATVNALLLPIREAFFERGAPLPGWLSPLDAKLRDAYTKLWAGDHAAAEKIYAAGVELVKQRLAAGSER